MKAVFWLCWPLCLAAVSGGARAAAARALVDKFGVWRGISSRPGPLQSISTPPELSFQEIAKPAARGEGFRHAGCEVTTGVGKGGVVGVLRNRRRRTVLIRADHGALPVEEQTGLP